MNTKFKQHLLYRHFGLFMGVVLSAVGFTVFGLQPLPMRGRRSAADGQARSQIVTAERPA